MGTLTAEDNAVTSPSPPPHTHTQHLSFLTPMSLPAVVSLLPPVTIFWGKWVDGVGGCGQLAYYTVASRHFSG